MSVQNSDRIAACDPQEHTDIVNADTDSFATPEILEFAPSLLQDLAALAALVPPSPSLLSLRVAVALPGWMSAVEQFHPLQAGLERPVRRGGARRGGACP